MWLLDTNACVALLNGTSAALAKHLAHHRPSEIRLCAVVKAELLFGARKSERVAENTRLLDAFFTRFVSLPFDDAGAVEYARLRHDLQASGTPIGPNDLMIAAIAVAQNLTLVTHNVREFSRVVGLKVEDWH
jgi:tRNA(fMet)-specific endonuclease VapC